MSDAKDTALPEQHDGEPDFAAEIARLDTDIKALIESITPSDDELKADLDAMQISDADYALLIANLDKLIPAESRADAPKDGSLFDQVMWRVTTAAKAGKAPVVPATDAKRPTLETPAEDLSSLPPHVRIARGYAA